MNRKLLSFLLCFLLLFAASCGRLSSQKAAAPPECRDSLDSPLLFAQKLVSASVEEKNFLISPLSVKLSLAMAANGAEGETQAEILSALGVKNLEEFNQYAKELGAYLTAFEDAAVTPANSIWLNKSEMPDAGFLPAYKSTIREFYNSSIETVKRNNAVRKINRWVKAQTKGRISELILKPNFAAALVNAFYFKADWKNPFTAQEVHKRQFQNYDGSNVSSDFIAKTAHYAYVENEAVQMIALPYCAENLKMYLLLPKEETRASLEMVSDDIFKQMKDTEVRLTFPKWSTEYSADLADSLQQLGIQTAFMPGNARFGNLFSSAEGLFIESVLHNTFINVTEQGTEAASSTAALLTKALSDYPAATSFTADRPFVYFIREDATGEILFCGEVLQLQP